MPENAPESLWFGLSIILFFTILRLLPLLQIAALAVKAHRRRGLRSLAGSAIGLALAFGAHLVLNRDVTETPERIAAFWGQVGYILGGIAGALMRHSPPGSRRAVRS